MGGAVCGGEIMNVESNRNENLRLNHLQLLNESQHLSQLRYRHSSVISFKLGLRIRASFLTLRPKLLKLCTNSLAQNLRAKDLLYRCTPFGLVIGVLPKVKLKPGRKRVSTQY